MFKGTIDCIVLLVVNGFEVDLLKHIVGACLIFVGISYGAM
jgi:hypothetical protein